MPTVQYAPIAYRLYVGGSLCSDVLACLSAADVMAATAYPARGMWGNTTEPCTVVEIVMDQSADNFMENLARTLARRFKQSCVMVTRSDLTFKALVKPG